MGRYISNSFDITSDYDLSDYPPKMYFDSKSQVPSPKDILIEGQIMVDPETDSSYIVTRDQDQGLYLSKIAEKNISGSETKTGLSFSIELPYEVYSNPMVYPGLTFIMTVLGYDPNIPRSSMIPESHKVKYIGTSRINGDAIFQVLDEFILSPDFIQAQSFEFRCMDNSFTFYTLNNMNIFEYIDEPDSTESEEDDVFDKLKNDDAEISGYLLK